jgi:S-DNA-T family DNA segregation ATPase FtsK/SpoIIIE
VASRVNSQIVLDDTGAESLLGNGDLLFLPPGSSQLVRAQGAYISDEEINQVINTIAAQSSTNYLIPSFDAFRSLDTGPDEEEPKGGKDTLYEQALSLVVASKSASTTFLQRKLKIGYARAASLMDELEENGIIGPQDGAKPRRVISSGQIQPALFDEEELNEEET